MNRGSVLRRTAALLAPAVLGAVLVGTAGASAEPELPYALADYPRPAVTGEELAAHVEAFSEGHALRITGTPAQLNAHDAIAAEARALGLQVETKTYKGIITALVATKPGTTRPDEAIVFSAHVDSMVGTITGAYDNASGVSTVLGLARAFADVPTHRTLEFHFYNGEEEGLLASKEIAEEYKATRRQVSANLNFDMVGIAWPVGGPTNASSCLCIWRGKRDVDLDLLLEDVHGGFLELPLAKDAVSLEGPNNRSSDEASWANAGFRTVRWAGLRTAAAYPEYHMPLDNMETIDRVVGGREFFEQGLANTLLSAYYTAAALDLEDVEAPAAEPVAPEDVQPQYTGPHAPGDGHAH